MPRRARAGFFAPGGFARAPRGARARARTRARAYTCSESPLRRNEPRARRGRARQLTDLAVDGHVGAEAFPRENATVLQQEVTVDLAVRPGGHLARGHRFRSRSYSRVYVCFRCARTVALPVPVDSHCAPSLAVARFYASSRTMRKNDDEREPRRRADEGAARKGAVIHGADWPRRVSVRSRPSSPFDGWVM